jgi:alkylation response protein AidB-like acyl-CoA dehydrogenase
VNPVSATSVDSSALSIEVGGWIKDNWSPDLTVREWWQRLTDAGYAYPSWPKGAGGLGLSAADARIVTQELARAKVVAPPVGHVAATLAAPTILEHGTGEQITRFLVPIARGEASWTQLFSEPGSGSDLASLGTRAVRDGDEWVINGQKVWNSAADSCQWGMLLARTDVDVPKHQGISYFLIDMGQPGVEARPLKQMNGTAAFCEVFFTNARVPDDCILGELNGGWAVAHTTLFYERNSVAGSGIKGLSAARSGPIAGDLDLTVAEIVERSERARSSRLSSGAVPSRMMLQLAREQGMAGDAVVRQRLAAYFTQTKVNTWTGRRVGAASGRLTGADGSLTKLSTSRICQQSRDLAFALIGAAGMLDGEDAPLQGDIQRVGLGSPGTRIGGGTDEIQLNTLGERALGLPREPATDKDVPYRQLQVGTQRRQSS